MDVDITIRESLDVSGTKSVFGTLYQHVYTHFNSSSFDDVIHAFKTFWVDISNVPTLQKS